MWSNILLKLITYIHNNIIEKKMYRHVKWAMVPTVNEM